MILKTIEKAFSSYKAKGWEYTFWAIDIHDTIFKSTYSAEFKTEEYYPFAKETLQLLTQRDDVKLILFTCSHSNEIKSYLTQFESDGIHFDYINGNPEVVTDMSGYGNYDKKFYINVGLDDKFGFEPSDWKIIFDFLKK